MVLPSGDQAGWRASLNRSVMRLAAPPEAGITQMLPCRSIASILPSGETDTAMEVPSSTVMLTGLAVDLVGLGAVWPALAARPSSRTSGIKWRFMAAPCFESILAG